MCRVVCNLLTTALISIQVYNSLASNQTETSTSANKEVRLCRFKDNLQVTKACSVNGTWELHPITKKPWTDYTVCFLSRLEDIKTIVLVNIYMNAASILFLGPAIIIFLAYKFLRREMIIMIHISFFTSLFLASVMLFLINTIFTYQNLINPKQTTARRDNFGCVSLNILHRYFDSATYFWMFCEASHLHQLTVNCFRPPRRMYMYHCFAWGLPLVLMIIYIILRVKSLHTVVDDDPKVNCWIPRAGQLEWIFNVPHIISSMLNVVFLCHILRQLFKLESHPNDPSSLRRSVKALILLLPLFGIQILIVTYRVPESSKHYFWVNIISDTIIGTKGLIVSVLFCYLNGEVLHYLRRTGLTCLPETRPDARKNSCPTINSEVSRPPTVNKSSSVHYKIKPKEACKVLLTASNKKGQTSTPV